MGGGLVGRRHELALLGRALARADLSAVVLVGEPGVGKTRLGVAALEIATEAGFHTTRVMATRAAAAIPFGAVAPLLPVGGAARERADLLRQAVSHVAGLGGDHPLVVLVDDAHLLDDASAAFVHQLVLTASAFVLATVRSAVDMPDAVVALWKDGIADRLDLGPLGIDATAELAGLILEGPLDTGVAATLHTASGGNPLFVHQLIVAGRRADTLRRVGGRWRIEGRFPLASGLVSAVEGRLGTLTPDDRAVLELVAFGEPLPADLLERVAGDSGAARLESLEARGLVVATESGDRLDIRLAHPLYAEVLRDRAPGSWSRRVRLRLADAFDAEGLTARHPLRVARWRLDAGAPIAADVALAASEEARVRADLPLAERLARAAVDAGGGFDARLHLALVLAQAVDSIALEQQLRALAADARGDDQVGAVAIARFDALAMLEGRYGDALRVLAEAEATLTDPSWRAECVARRSFLLAMGGAADVALAEVSIYAGDESLSRRATGYASLAAATACLALGRITETVGHTRAGTAALAPLTWIPTLPEPTAFDQLDTLALLLAGRVDDARTAGLEAVARAEARGSELSRGWMEWILAQVERVAGRPATGAALASVAVERLRVRTSPAFVANVAAELVVAEAVRGRAAAAAEALALVLEGGRPDDAIVLHAEAWHRAATGNLMGAGERLRAAGQSGNGALARALALDDLARLGAPRPAAAALAELAADVEGDLVPALARHAAALTTGRADDLRAAAEHLDALGVRLVAAETAAAAAIAYGRDARPSPAQDARALAERLLTQCEDAATTSFEAAEARAVLSRREHEVAALAANGLGNREIADRLRVSKRTVDAQLQRVYDKLGIDGRTELSSVLGVPAAS